MVKVIEVIEAVENQRIFESRRVKFSKNYNLNLH